MPIVRLKGRRTQRSKVFDLFHLSCVGIGIPGKGPVRNSPFEDPHLDLDEDKFAESDGTMGLPRNYKGVARERARWHTPLVSATSIHH